MSDLWIFARSFDRSRGERLEQFGSFDELVEIIRGKAQIVDAYICEGKELGPKACCRPAVLLTVEAGIFDRFFNSPEGYRAQYLRDPDRGQAANGQLLRALEPALTGAVVGRCGEERLSREWIRNSFLANSAKIWPDEETLDFTDATIDLAIERWTQPCDWINAPKHAGLWAPEGTQLKVFGAFIDPHGNEIVSRRKIRRRFDIHECGFS
jgi:hypothetical protein